MNNITPFPWRTEVRGNEIVIKGLNNDAVTYIPASFLQSEFTKRENARLIQAAPEMYSVLLRIREVLRLGDNVIPNHTLLTELNAIVQLIEGV